MGGSAYDNTDYFGFVRRQMENEANFKKPKYVEAETPESYLKRVSQLPDPNPLHEELDTYLNQFARRVRERLDAVSHRALSEGKHGVKVTNYIGDGSMLMEVSEEVPFGEIHYYNEDGPAKKINRIKGARVSYETIDEIFTLAEKYPETYG